MLLVVKSCGTMNRYKLRSIKADKTNNTKQIAKTRILHLWQTMDKENSALVSPTVQLTSALHVQEPRKRRSFLGY